MTNPTNPRQTDEDRELIGASIFDLLEPLSKALVESGGPDLRGGFARMTGGVDIPYIVEALTTNAQRPSDKAKLEERVRVLEEAMRMIAERGGSWAAVARTALASVAE